MFYTDNIANLVLSGGGVKGIAFIGALEIFAQRGWQFYNIAGVSAGAIVGSILAAGYSPLELRKILDSFVFEKIKISDIPVRVPIISKYMNYNNGFRSHADEGYEMLLTLEELINSNSKVFTGGLSNMRGNLFDCIHKLCKQGCLFDGDYLEEWISKVLAKKGVRTFGDLRGGLADRVNPSGYRMRMTAVDATRAKVVVLPDDIAFYGINPDSLEVAKAVRMSASVPFVFKPVELKKSEGNFVMTYNLVDGGVFDKFPFWLIEHKADYSLGRHQDFNIPTIGMRLVGNKSIISLDTPLTILKGIISSIHDIGVPQKLLFDHEYYIKINTSNISFLDFDLSDNEMNQLINSGRDAALKFFEGNRRFIHESLYYQRLYYESVLILAVLMLRKFLK
ncbi:MAG: patatin-like phospholipase family protein [Bacillota bacterium]